MDSLSPRDLTQQELPFTYLSREDAAKAKKRAYNKAYYQSHHAEIRQQQKEYRETHSEEIQGYQQEWKQSHREYNRVQAKTYRQIDGEKINARRRARYRANPELIKAASLEYARNHREHVRARQKAHRQANFEQYKARNAAYYHANKHGRIRLLNKTIKARRRVRKTQAGGSYTVQEWKTLKASYDYTCLCCGRQEPEIKLTADHVIPVSKHGTSFIDNIQPLCGSCNSKKHDKVIDYRVRWQK